jgi:predicted PurR-regulated permease PerM
VSDARDDSVAAAWGGIRANLGWFFVAAVVLWFAYATRGVLGPFLAGLVIAYLLDPVADRIEARGAPRWLATIIVLLLFFGTFVVLATAIAPVLFFEFEQLSRELPQLFAQLRPLAQRLLNLLGGFVEVDTLTGDIAARIGNWAASFAGSLLSGGLAVINVLAILIMMPVVAFYALRDFDALTARIDGWWPHRYAGTIRALLRQSDTALAGFLRGQSMVCLSLAVFYAVGWSLVGLDYGLVLGILAGVLGFVPYLGYVVSVSLALLVGFGQWGFEPLSLGLVLGVFFVGQVLESSVLTPNLVGNRIGIHPLWVLFAVFAGGELAGVIGVFLAVPVAAILGVIVRWLMEEYLKSPIYRSGPRSAETADPASAQ